MGPGAGCTGAAAPGALLPRYEPQLSAPTLWRLTELCSGCGGSDAWTRSMIAVRLGGCLAPLYAAVSSLAMLSPKVCGVTTT